jgi:hypothetical protein
MRSTLLILTLGILGCSPKILGGLPETTGDESTLGVESTGLGETTAATDQDTYVSATEVGTTVDTTVDTSATEVGTTDVGTTDVSTTDIGTTGPGEQHRECEQPFPQPAPALPSVNIDAQGVPLFDGWTKIACEDVTAQPCGAEGDPACNGICLRGTDDGPGVCGGIDIDIWCDGEGEAINYDEFGCWVCAEVELHALACCNDLPGFDCRTWPYPSDGPIGSVCARHDDCESGLVCGAHKGEGYGICQCPGLNAEDVVPPGSCFGG